MINDIDILRDSVLKHSVDYPGTLKDIAQRIGIDYGAFRMFMRRDIKSMSFENMCKVNKYLNEYGKSQSNESSALSTLQICDLHNSLRSCNIPTMDAMEYVCEELEIEDIRFIDSSKIEAAMNALKKIKRTNQAPSKG